MTDGHYIICEDCNRAWLIDDLPGECRWSECTFINDAKQIKKDLERLREVRDDYGSGIDMHDV